MSKFSIRLRELRQSKNLSQQKLADLLGISKSSINMYERGEREPGLDLLEAIADFFNVDIDYLLGKSNISNKALSTAEKLFPYQNLTPKKYNLLNTKCASIQWHERIKARRIELNMTSKELANALGIAPSSYCQYENGKREPDICKIQAISKILNISLDYLIFGKAIDVHTDEEKQLINNYRKLDEIDKAEIRGEIKQMLKADKYKRNITNTPLYPRKIAAYGADGTNQINPPNPRKIT